MATAILFGLPAHGQTNPTLPIVAELVRQGEQIIYYSTEEFRAPIEATGADFRAYGYAFDDTFKFVGPSIAPRITDPAFPFEALHDGPLLSISLGTLFHRQNEFYRCCFQAFEQSDYQIVMSIGQHTTREQPGRTPENFMVCQSVQQLELLQRVTLFITHAGMNSTNEALYYGVPLLAIPQATDQHSIARRIEQTGAGIRLSRKRVTASRLRSSADEIRTHAYYAQASARIGASLRQAGGFRAALQAIQQFKQRYHIEQFRR